MVIFDNLGFQTRSDVPNSDWTGIGRYVVEDGSPLYKKILRCESFEPVEDDEGKLVDVIPVGEFYDDEDDMS